MKKKKGEGVDQNTDSVFSIQIVPHDEYITTKEKSIIQNVKPLNVLSTWGSHLLMASSSYFLEVSTRQVLRQQTLYRAVQRPAPDPLTRSARTALPW